MEVTPVKPQVKRRISTPSQHGQLTGFPRRVKDAVADVYNAIQKWEKLKNEGFGILSDLANLKISNRGDDEKSCYPQGLEKLCNKLSIIYKGMEGLSDKLKKISSQMRKISELGKNGSSEFFFLSWPASEFYKRVSDLSKMYELEAQSKYQIVQSVAHVDLLPHGGLRDPESTRDILMTYVACWLHEPYICEQTKTLLLEELLLETGHKQ